MHTRGCQTVSPVDFLGEAFLRSFDSEAWRKITVLSKS